MRLAALVAALSAATALGTAQGHSDKAAIRQLVRDASRALQSGNAPLFLAAFDRRAMPGFARFREQVTALTAQRRIASSVESTAPEKGPGEWSVRVNWLLELTPRLDPGPIERRHETLVLGLRRRGGRWKIVRIDPSDFFASANRVAP